MKLRIAIVLAALAGQLAHASPAAGQQDLQALLERPLTPGSVALLVEHVKEQAAQKRLIEAVKHEDPAVRAVAARVGFVTSSRGLAPPLIATLAKEQNVHTAVEQIRALMSMLGEPGDSLVMRHVERLGGPAAAAMAESLARTRPADLIKHLPALVAAAGEHQALGGEIAGAMAQHPASASEIVQAGLATKNEKLWNTLLESTRYNTDVPVPSAILMQALTSSEEYQRAGVIWHMFHIIDAGDPAPEDVLAAASAPKPAAPGAAAADLTWEDFGREMLARARGTAPTKADWASLMTLEKNRARLLPKSDEIYPYLTEDELKSLSIARSFERADSRRRRGPRDKRPSTDRQSRMRVMRTIPVFAKGLLGDLLQVTGCRPPDESYLAVGDVTYRAEGAPERISVAQASMSRACDQFVHSMMKLTIAASERPIMPEAADRIVMLFNRQYLACADDPFPPNRPRMRPDSTIVPPRRLQAAKIVYPASAQRNRIKGVVQLGVRLSYTGCIGAAETLRSADPLLDLAAIRGVFSAAYSPTLLDGQPVEAIVTYTINFELR